MKTYINSLILIVSLVFSGMVSAGTANLLATWDKSPSVGVTGYRVFYGTAPGVYTASFDVGDVASATIPNLEASTDYFVVLKSMDASGNLSIASNEGTARTNAAIDPITPLLPPTNVFISP